MAAGKKSVGRKRVSKGKQGQGEETNVVGIAGAAMSFDDDSDLPHPLDLVRFTDSSILLVSSSFRLYGRIILSSSGSPRWR